MHRSHDLNKNYLNNQNRLPSSEISMPTILSSEKCKLVKAEDNDF